MQPPSLPRGIFWVLLVVLLGLSGFFIAASYRQMQSVLADVKKVPVSATLKHLETPGAIAPTESSLLALEHDVMQQRHQRSTAFIVTRTWMRFMSLMFGTLMVTIGATFVLGRVAGPGAEATVNAGEAGGSLKTSSPGLFMIAFGVVLIAIPNLSTQRIDTTDAATYFLGPSRLPSDIPGASTPLTVEDEQNIQALLRQFSGTSTTPP